MFYMSITYFQNMSLIFSLVEGCWGLWVYLWYVHVLPKGDSLLVPLANLVIVFELCQNGAYHIRDCFGLTCWEKEPLLSTQDQCFNWREEQYSPTFFDIVVKHNNNSMHIGDDFLIVITYLEGYTYQVSMCGRGTH